MTFAEINRAIESKKRVMVVEEKQQAIQNYILADLIGYSVSRIHNKNNKMPTLYEAYPSLFSEKEEEEKIERQKIDRFKAQLLQFSRSHNKKLEGVKNTQ